MKKLMVFILIPFSFLFVSYLHEPSETSLLIKKEKPPKNVIFIIADGMGPASFTGTRIWAKGSEGELAMEKMPVTGYVKTYSASNFVTDSAASGTALASGVKTYNTAIGLTYEKVDPSGTSRPLETIADVMKKAGKSVGVITTTRVTHATPASFYAHVKNRHMENEIATQVGDSSLDLLMGGGRRHFLPEAEGVNLKKRRLDDRDVIEEVKEKGWSYVSNKKDLMNFKAQSASGPLLGIFNESHVSYERERAVNSADKEPSLNEMTKFAVNFLGDNEKGFFLMIEAGRIDHASHENVIEDMVRETLMLDETVKDLLASSLMKDTLLVITADHETAGLAVSGYGDVEEVRGDKLFEVKKDENGFLSSYISWASGPNSSLNPDLPKGTLKQPAAQYAEEARHSAVDVMILSAGPGSSNFMGFMNNTEVPRKILSLTGLRFTSPVNEENPVSL